MSERVRVRSIYVHAPFCARRCFYCDFAVSVDASPDPEPWLGAIGSELARARATEVELEALLTLYVGGGTPSLLGVPGIRGLGDLFCGLLDEPSLEWTIEANPESFSADLARAWSAAGVNRVSLGVQSFHPSALRWMGRLHGPDGPGRAVLSARAGGIENLSLDLIFGLPGRLGRSWSDDLERALALDVPHVSLYGLTVEPRTPLGRAVREQREQPIDEARYTEEYLEAADRLTRAGYEHYEVSSFARPGLRSRHNATYWTGTPYLGLGNGAHSFLPPVRRWNLRDWPAYRTEVDGGRSPVEGAERLDADAARLERIWLGLRTCTGVERPPPDTPAGRLCERWMRSGRAVPGGAGIRLTPTGWLVLDELAVQLDRALALG